MLPVSRKARNNPNNLSSIIIGIIHTPMQGFCQMEEMSFASREGIQGLFNFVLS